MPAPSEVTATKRLLTFAVSRDLDEMRPGQLGELRRAVAVIAALASSHGRGRGTVSPGREGRDTALGWLSQAEQDLPWGSPQAREVTLATLTELQRRLREYLDALFPRGGFGDAVGGSVPLPARVSGLHLQRLNAGPFAPVELRFIVPTWRDAFWLSVATLLEGLGTRLRRCPTCGALFLKERKMIFCSLKCGGTARARTYYVKHRPTKRTSATGRTGVPRRRKPHPKPRARR